MTKTFTPTEEQLQAANALFLAMAYTRTIRPTIEAIQQKHIDIMQPLHRKTGEIITDPKKAWRMKDDDFSLYLGCVEEDVRKAGFVFEPGTCPLLRAEHAEIKARQDLCRVMEPITKFSWDMFFKSTKWEANMNEYFNLTLKLFAPFCKERFFSCS